MRKHKQRISGTAPGCVLLSGGQHGDGRAVSLIRLLVLAMLTLWLGLASVPAHANMTCNNSGSYNWTLPGGSIAIPANITAGTSIGTLATQTYTMQCRFLQSGNMITSGTNTVTFATTAELAYGTTVYKTNIAGLGVRYTFNADSCSSGDVVMTSGKATFTCAYSGPLGGGYMGTPISVKAELVVTGPIQGGISTLTTSPAVSIAFVASDSPSSWGQGNLYSGVATGSLTQATCAANSANVTVTLPKISVNSLASGVGAVASGQPFMLEFTCTTGANISMVLTDSVNQANRGDTLAVTSDSTASGVGIQILKAGTPILFGPDSAAPGTANQWLIGASPNGKLQVPLTARYIRTGAVSPGTIKALATFTMSYN
ncbi:type 1 fimbria pilin [Silvimonas terrae]|uniref:Type 1 fimbria pilin n=1 Tax=Silvimonas terrae TaxID=300266 RepID=A0A840RHV1_9NEIS|nr:fimbrial protein [Silvimonas terrae]MBB5191771.1 type 1 fimbria pilin [Silvimonas terrae]